jgi:hypothetical protein
LRGTVLLLLLGAFLAGCRPIQPPVPAVTVATQNSADTITVSGAGDEFLVDVVSPRGIGGTTLEFAPGTPPATVTLQLHLAGLEEFTADNGVTTLKISVASRPPYSVAESVADSAGGAGAQTIAAGDAAWAQVQIVPADPTAPPAIPLTDGYIAVTLPAGFVGGEFSSLVIRWIDFYR